MSLQCEESLVNDVFNDMRFIELIDDSCTYEELRVKCDIENVECIIDETEFYAFKANSHVF